MTTLHIKTIYEEDIMKRRILSLIMVFVVTVSLCSCGTPSPTDTVDKFLNGIKTQNNEEIKGDRKSVV